MGSSQQVLRPTLSAAAPYPQLQAPWEHVPGQSLHEHAITVQELLRTRPDEVLRTLQLHGVSKLGEFKMPDTLALPAFDGEDTGIIALGSSSRELDYERFWRAHLAKAVPQQRKEEEAGWSNDLVLEAYVVNVRGAADPDKQGLLQPLLKRWQAGAIGLAPFGLPAVQAVIEWKWRSFARRLLLWELAVFVLWLLAFIVFTTLFQDEVGLSGSTPGWPLGVWWWWW